MKRTKRNRKSSGNVSATICISQADAGNSTPQKSFTILGFFFRKQASEILYSMKNHCIHHLWPHSSYSGMRQEEKNFCKLNKVSGKMPTSSLKRWMIGLTFLEETDDWWMRLSC